MPEFRDLPSIDLLLNDPAFENLNRTFGPLTVRNVLRQQQNDIRANKKVPDWAISPSEIAKLVTKVLRNQQLVPVFNLTGTIIHTNLGRALLSEDLWQALTPLVTRPVNLEYNLVTGKRGKRDDLISKQLQTLTGAEAALVVNNNAAALLLVLNTFALGKNVPVSRGELIEIGGSFRLPELMTRAGCTLVEVGTTNRTHLRDFEAVSNQAALLMKVHPSNFHIEGFTNEVPAKQLAELAHQHNIPSCVDLGSGTLVDLTRWGLPAEPTPQSVLDDNIDLVTFSGDKLLGGVQCGIIVGRADLIEQMNQNPLKRALRADKVTLAILSETLRLYEQPDQLQETLPLLQMLLTPLDTLEEKAAALIHACPHGLQGEIMSSSVQIGSGAMPDQNVPSIAVGLIHKNLSAKKLEEKLRNLPTPIIGRIADNKVMLDMRGANPFDELLKAFEDLQL